jgi:amino acid adenylation domain-containing protein
MGKDRKWGTTLLEESVGVSLMSVLEKFGQQANSFPDSIAVRSGAQRVAYGELNEQADRVAHALRIAGVKAETLVGVFLDRSANMLSGLLGIWKAGGAYVALDPTLPAQRLSFMLEDCDVRYLITQRALLASLPKHHAQVICVEDVLLDMPVTTSDFLNEPPSPDRLAYVIYTSGSTGKPKGVEICHGGLANVLDALANELSLSPTDIVLAMTTIAFDVSILQLFLPLIRGACTYIVAQECARDGARLIEVMRQSGATLMLGTPTLWNLLLEAGWQGDPNLQICSGGEILPLSLGRTLARMSRVVWNHYGPSEASICASTEQVRTDSKEITIGSPIANVHFHILDPNLQPVPRGNIGEIYISGIGVGRGYIKREDLNETCFLPDPAIPGGRIYKTGDLGRELPNGRFEFLGRVDEQVKIRGFRIELKEIEEAIREYNGVQAVSVQAIDISEGDRRLVAYVQSALTVETQLLKEHLRGKLPSYMIPSEYVAIDALPTTVNGKVDRAALRAIRPKAATETRTILRPRNEMEDGLRSIWEKMLQISPISMRDNFFELGGHSFLAAKMFAEIEKKLGKKIPLSMLIENPTIETLAACIREQETKQEWPGVITIQAAGKRPPLFIAHGLGGSLLLFRDLANMLGPDQPIYGLQLVPGIVDQKDKLSIPELASVYARQIKAIYPSGPYHVAGHSMGGLIAYEIVSQLSQAGEEIGLLALIDCDFRSFSSATESSTSIWEAVKVGLQRSASMIQRASGTNRNELIQRKVFYEKLKLKIALLKHFSKIDRILPNLFEDEVYVALSTEEYDPQPYYGDAVAFIAADQPRTNRNFGSGWSEIIRGRFELLRIAGNHQSIFTPPYIDLLAQELTRRLQLIDESRTQKIRSVLTGS